MKNRESGIISFPVYIGVGIVLCAVFFGALLITKQYAQSQKDQTTTRARQTPDQEAAAEKKKQQEQAEQQKAKEVEEKKAATKAQQEQAAAPKESTPPAPQVVASTGPEDTLLAVLGVVCLSYATYVFVRSRRALYERQQRPSLT